MKAKKNDGLEIDRRIDLVSVNLNPINDTYVRLRG